MREHASLDDVEQETRSTVRFLSALYFAQEQAKIDNILARELAQHCTAITARRVAPNARGPSSPSVLPTSPSSRPASVLSRSHSSFGFLHQEWIFLEIFHGVLSRGAASVVAEQPQETAQSRSLSRLSQAQMHTQHQSHPMMFMRPHLAPTQRTRKSVLIPLKRIHRGLGSGHEGHQALIQPISPGPSEILRKTPRLCSQKRKNYTRGFLWKARRWQTTVHALGKPS